MRVRATVARCASYAAVGAVTVAAVWHAFGTRASAPLVAASAEPAARTAASRAATASEPASAAALPASLAGSRAPRLPLDARGRLAKQRAVRDFFDYFLLAEHDLDAAALDAQVTRAIAAQLDGTDAEHDALDVWQRYRAYRTALGQQRERGGVGDGRDNPDALAALLDRRAALASRMLGDWCAAFFDEEWRQQRDRIERLRIVRDPALTDAQKRDRLAALDALRPAALRDADARLQRQRDALDAVARLERARGDADTLRAQAAATLAPDVAARVVKLRDDDDAWRARYRDYAAERDRIDAQSLPREARDAQLAQWRQRAFANPAEAMRAAALDAGRDAAAAQ
ncbi:lipase secretion chaperone [Burkholderia multivorans]|uniref:lipase secretion chaperone n=1 Tax=Burkholderia multivorans TaxID=87883 RepID=UPI000D011135|nr:lipase secretion chaperone [Burkholderia multivorans]PRF52351.1 lipase secretion chaperone [Burkholderia multivorans]PRG72561.1 lipase secretion chaperone [Burkholderia multivorans]